MKKTPKKRYHAKRYPLYAIQFYINKENGNVCMLETSNIPDGTEPLARNAYSMMIYGRNIADSQLLTNGDKDALMVFCEEYIIRYKNKNL